MFVRKHFTPIPADADVSVRRWLENCNSYTQTRKNELLSLWERNACALRREHARVKLFTKTETYPSFKHARGINSRDDMFKCFSGPYFKLIEEEVYRHPAFIKHVPVRERPAYILQMLGKYPGPFAETDYSQFESHFVPEVLESIEFELYRYMLGNFPTVFNKVRQVLAGENVCESRWFRIRVQGRRMSGEMCTSLGNGFSNLVLSHFVAAELGGVVEGVVEGDDGLFHFSRRPDASDYERVGFRIKMKWHDDLLRTSFCGLVMSRDLSTMTDPRKVLINFGWTHSPLMLAGKKVRMGLLRAKALSLAYEHPRCPILHTLALKGLAITEGFTARFETGWYEADLRAQIRKFSTETAFMLEQGPSFDTRVDFAQHFGITIPHQLAIEEDITKSCGSQLESQVILAMFESGFEDCKTYANRYLSFSPQVPPM